MNTEIDKKINPPAVSVVMSVFNGEKYLKEAIESVLQQTFTDFEFIIINDASTDKSEEIIFSYQDNRIRYLKNETNLGVAATPNIAIKTARAKYIARIDCDDVCMPNRLALQYEYMQKHPEVVVVGSAANFIDMDGVKICTHQPKINDEDLREVFPEPPFINPTVMFRKDYFYLAGQYNEEMRWGGEDAVFFGQLSKFGKMHNLDVPLINYRLVPGSMSRKPAVFRRILLGIIADQISGNAISSDRFDQLKKEAQKINKSKMMIDYHFEVAKLILWSGGSKNRAREHLRNCLPYIRFLPKIILMYLFLLIPKRILGAVYFMAKGRRFE
jgi:glycosyltransferase involved in cell wall biosynthesis